MSSVGRPAKYKISHLTVGEAALLPWEYGPNDKINATNGRHITNSICQHQRRTGKRFHKEGRTDGLLVTRIL